MYLICFTIGYLGYSCFPTNSDVADNKVELLHFRKY